MQCFASHRQNVALSDPKNEAYAGTGLSTTCAECLQHLLKTNIGKLAEPIMGVRLNLSIGRIPGNLCH